MKYITKFRIVWEKNALIYKIYLYMCINLKNTQTIVIKYIRFCKITDYIKEYLLFSFMSLFTLYQIPWIWILMINYSWTGASGDTKNNTKLLKSKFFFSFASHWILNLTESIKALHSIMFYWKKVTCCLFHDNKYLLAVL